jgi:hypothetical protein
MKHHRAQQPERSFPLAFLQQSLMADAASSETQFLSYLRSRPRVMEHL